MSVALTKPMQRCMKCGERFKAKGTKQKYCSLLCAHHCVMVGRKPFKGRTASEVIAQCKQVWAIGGTDAEAAAFAGISVFSLCRYLQKHPELVELRNALKQGPILLARITVVAHIGDSYSNAMNYLERKRPDEFGRGAWQQAAYNNYFSPDRDPNDTTGRNDPKIMPLVGFEKAKTEKQRINRLLSEAGLG